MSSPHPTMETIVANGRIGPYPIPTGTTDKLASAAVGSEEFQYMLATYCFDAQRKLLYLCKAALPILEHVDPEFQRAVWEDSRDIDSAPDPTPASTTVAPGKMSAMVTTWPASLG